MDGWIRIYRRIVENQHYFYEPFNKIMAWVDLLIITNHKDGYFYKRGIRVEVKRGQSGYDIETLAKRWKWSRGKVERFLNDLETDKQITRQKTNVTTIISICNYDEYQSDDKPKRSTTVKQTDTNKNDKEENTNVFSDNWRTNFENYRANCKKGFNEAYYDEVFIAKMEYYYPQLNIKKSIELTFENWCTPDGWNEKKKSKTVKIDWKATIRNAMAYQKNRVYKTKEELAAQ